MRGFDLTWNWSPVMNCACTCVCVCVCVLLLEVKSQISISHEQKRRSCPNLPTRWHRTPPAVHTCCVFSILVGGFFPLPCPTLTFAQIKNMIRCETLRVNIQQIYVWMEQLGRAVLYRAIGGLRQGISWQQQLRPHMEAWLRNSSECESMEVSRSAVSDFFGLLVVSFSHPLLHSASDA